MPIPLSIILFDRGANGVPTTNNPVNLAGKAEGYEDALSDKYGFETARVSWTPSKQDVIEWARADHLLRPMAAYSPDGRTVFEGFLAEIEIKIGTKTIAFSIKDMANRLTVRYSTPDGGQGDTSIYSNTASQALFGIKDRVINASIAASAAASNQAQTVLNAIAFPRSKQPSSGGTPRGGMQITLTFWGKYALLDWLLTSSTSTTNTTTSTQVGSLLAAFVAVNNFFSSSTAYIATTGVSDTEYTEPDTTYREKIERLLARGNSSQQPLAWGFYDGGVFTVAARASATPDTITYYESEASGQIRDTWQNIVEPWDVRPNAMALVTDLIDAPLVGAAETPLRKYVARVRRSIRGNEVSVTLEPDDTESLEALLTSPAGAGPAGTSDRQAAFERRVTAPARSVFPAADNAGQYDGGTGVWRPQAGGTGASNPSTAVLTMPSPCVLDGQGGTITNSGGGSVDVGTGAGIGGAGSTGVSTGGGTTGRIAQWSSSSQLTAATLIKSGAGVLTLSVASAMTLTLSGGSATLDFSTPTSGDALVYDGSKFTPTALTAADVGAVDGTGTAGRVAQWSDADTLTSATLIKSGAGVLTLSASSTVTLTIDSTTRLNGSGASSGDVLTWNGTAYAPAAPSSGVTGSGAANKIAIWSSSSALTSDTNLHWDTTNNRLGINNTTPAEALHVTGNIRASGTVKTAAGVTWDLGAASSIPSSAINVTTLIVCTIGGASYDIFAKPSGS